MISTRRTTSVLVLFVGIASALLSWMASNTHALNDMRSAPPVPTTEVRRENHLDHFDSDTLAYYLDNYDGYDVAVMFYASWDTNSHQLAPYWNDIAYKMKAGTTQSKLIMVSAVMSSVVGDFGLIHLIAIILETFTVVPCVYTILITLAFSFFYCRSVVDNVIEFLLV
jgi:hypothetical protein